MDPIVDRRAHATNCRQRAFVLAMCIGAVLTSNWCAADEPADSQADNQPYPFGLQLRVLARDLTSREYHEVLPTLITTDLAAEWLRVGTPDNYLTFLEKHGGKEKVLADLELKAAYLERKRISDEFIELMRKAYRNRDRKPPFEEPGAVEEVLRSAAEIEFADQQGGTTTVRVVMPAPGSEKQWPRLRGPTGQGTAFDAAPPLRWSNTENVVWKSELPGRGNSSPVIWDDRLFVTSASEDGSERSLYCFSRRDGEQLWKRDVPPPESMEKLYWKNSYASATPVTDGERVIAVFGSAGIACFDFEGEMLWHQPLGPFITMHGPGTSPVLYKDKVIYIQDQNRGDSVFVAFDKQTGEKLWQRHRENAMGWSTPVTVRVGDDDQLVYNGSHYVVGYDPDTGEEIWRLGGSTREAIPMLVVGGGLIYSASGRNGPMLAIRPGGTGDVTETHLRWRTQRGAPHVPSPVYHDGRLFVVNDLGILSCLDAATGESLWQKRLRGRFSMSPIEANGRLLLTNENGRTYVLAAADRYEELAVNDLNENTLATPAVLADRIYFRTAKHLFCIGESTTASAE